jgi:hypothetical protein
VVVDDKAVPPPKTAYIDLKEVGATEYMAEFSPPMQSKNRQGQPFEVRSSNAMPRPELSLVKDLGGGLKIKSRLEFWEEVLRFSNANKRLRLWLNALHHAEDGPYAIILNDHIGLPFPWEMVAFDDEETGEAKRLGSAFVVVRWPISDRIDFPPHALPEQVEGKVVVYLSDDISKGELQTLQQYTQGILNDIQQFKRLLLEGPAGYGLVYLGCHAVLAEHTLRWMVLGNRQKVEQQLRLYDLQFIGGEFARLKLLRNSRAVVFINACHSALVSETDARTGVRESFTETFLDNYASGVIGTIGLVDDKDFAPTITRELIEQMNQGIPIAEALQRVRESRYTALNTILNRERRNPTHEELKDFFNAFMYVYYGNPLTRLKVQ